MKKLTMIALGLLAMACGRNASDKVGEPAIAPDSELEAQVQKSFPECRLTTKSVRCVKSTLM